jgi:hypothetical protein
MIQSALAFLILAIPPQVEITGKGTKIVSGQVTVTVLADGSVLIKSPSANLVIPAADADPVVPPGDDLADALRAIYGADQDTAKKAKLALLIKSYQAALESLDKAATAADFAQALSKSQSLKAADLRPLRDRIAQEIQSSLGTDPDAILDANAAKSLLQKLINILKGI